VIRALVFGGPLSPIGWQIGFLRQPFDVACRVTLEWSAQIASAFSLEAPRSRAVGAGDLLTSLRFLDPLQTPPRRELLVGGDAGWTAHFMNCHLGGDSVSWTGHLSQVLACEAVKATHIPQGDYPYPATAFELSGPTGGRLGYVRTIRAGLESRWTFETSGEVQPFEEPERYAARQIRDRFTRDTLIRYLAALGIDVDRESWWGDALLIESGGGTQGRESTLAETRREYGIR